MITTLSKRTLVLNFEKNNKNMIIAISRNTTTSAKNLKILSKKFKKSTLEISPANPLKAMLSAIDVKIVYDTNLGSVSFLTKAKNTMIKIDAAMIIRAISLNIFFSFLFLNHIHKLKKL
jgi:hypothetical protein